MIILGIVISLIFIALVMDKRDPLAIDNGSTTAQARVLQHQEEDLGNSLSLNECEDIIRKEGPVKGWL